MAQAKFTRTIYGAVLQTANLFNTPVEVPEFSTLNEAVNDSVVLPFQPTISTAGSFISADYDFVNDRPTVGYFCIGNKGRTSVIDAQGVVNTPLVKHGALNGNLYGLIPFVARPIDDDLTPSEQARFRLRKVVEVDTELFVLYFLMKMPEVTTAPQPTIKVIENQVVVSTTPFSPTIQNLRPVHPTNAEINASGGTYASVRAPITIPFSVQDAQNAVDAYELLYGSDGASFISEIGIVSGVDKLVTGRYPNTGTQTIIPVSGTTIHEAKAAQIILVAAVELPIGNLSSDITISFDIGAAEPLYRTEQL